MPASSKAQQRFMGMVHAAQKGEEPASPEVAKAADSMSDKDAKDFASTSHKGLPDKKEEIINTLKERIRQIVRETMIDEMNTTGNVEGYNTPIAFGKPENEKKKGKKQADLTGYSVVNEGFEVHYSDGIRASKKFGNERQAIQFAKDLIKTKKGLQFVDVFNAGSGFHSTADTNAIVAWWGNNSYAANKAKSDSKLAKKKIDEVLCENRWLELKNEEATAQSKIGRGISNINKQLKEMERFLNWYGKIKNESGVNNKSYWKRTNNHIYSIKERLIKLDQKIRQISE